MLLKSLPKFLFAAFSIFIFQNIKAQNETEPNNTTATANTVVLNGSGNGQINPVGDVDWWKITTTNDGKLDITLTDNSDDYTKFYLYDNNGTTLLNSGTTTSHTSNTFSTDGLAAGTYYIEFTGYNTSVDTSTYSFTNTLTPAPVANDKEPDSTRAQALTLPLNGSTTGHVGYYYNNHRDSSDWYKVTTTADGLLKFTITTEPSTLNAYINYTLYDNDGTTVLTQNYIGSNTTNSFSIDGLAAGTYYIKMFQHNPNVDYVSYILADSLFAAPVANDKEPDSTRAQALTLPLNGSTTGHVGYYYNNHRDSSDWYKVTTTADGLLRLTITTEPSTLNAYVNYILYDNNGTTVINQNYIGSNTTNSFSIDGLAAGTYYIKMFQHNPNVDYVSYILADSLLEYQYAEDSSYEPNKYASQAKTILSDRSTTGHFGFYYNNLRDTTDWFKINYTGTGNLSFVLNHLPHIIDGFTDYLNFYVYKDTTASSIYQATFHSETSDIVNLSGLSEGYYYIKITQYNPNDFEAYSLLDSFVQVDKALISINNSRTTLNSSSCGMDSITYNVSASHSPYTVRLYKNDVLYDSVITDASTVTFNGLDAGDYYATVYGDGATDSAYSKSATFTVLPPVPTSLTTSDIGVHTATLNWTKLDCANYYKIQYRAVGSTTWTVINTIGDTTKFELTGLSPYTLYTWQVASVEMTKGLTFTSAFADSVTFITLSDTAHIALTHKGLGGDCNSDTLTYTSSNSAAPYTVTLYRNGVMYGSPLSVTDKASFYNVPPGNYYATSTGTGSGGSYGKSDTTQILPIAPTGLDTSMVATTTAMLSWDAISCANYFTVQYKVSGTSTWTTVSVSANNTTLTNLMPDTKYSWLVSASDSFNNQTVTSANSVTSTFTTMSVLPVTFISFDGRINGDEALLTWSTVNEINNKGYEVQRSYDGENFNPIGFVNGDGNSSAVNNYSYTDVKVISGSNYYRLKQIDNDGRFNYSSVIKLDYSKFSWLILGNIGENNSWVQLQLDRTANVSLQIISIGGIIIQTINKGNLTAGTYSIPLNLSNAGAGMYIVKLLVNNQQYSKKLIK
ncbi:MAG: fibronectin type III domain-containing protein [Bacteroidetes bacterium]|nr:fibronectin type III domain-containing protein [Bacteroidota bacterium]